MLFLTIETTGLPDSKTASGFRTYFSPQNIKKYNNSRITQISFVLDQDEESFEYNSFIKLDPKIKIHEEAQKLNNITWDLCNEKGEDIKIVLDFLESQLSCVEKIVCNHSEFVLNVLRSECYRIGNSSLGDSIGSLQKKSYCLFSQNGRIALKNIAKNKGIKVTSLLQAPEKTDLVKQIYYSN